MCEFFIDRTSKSKNPLGGLIYVLCVAANLATCTGMHMQEYMQAYWYMHILIKTVPACAYAYAGVLPCAYALASTTGQCICICFG